MRLYYVDDMRKSGIAIAAFAAILGACDDGAWPPAGSTIALTACEHASGNVGYGETVESALSTCDRVLASDPRNAKAYRSRARAWINARQPQNALAEIDHIVAFEQSGDAYLYRARVRAYVGDKHGAVDDMSRGIALGAATVHDFRERARLLIEFERTDEAIADLSEAIARAFDRPEHHRARAELYQSLGRATEAEADAAIAARLEKALQILRTGRDRDQVRAEVLAQALDAAPDAAFVHDARARYYSKFGQYMEALEAIDRALALSPKADGTDLALRLSERSDILEAMGRHEEAVSTMVDAMKLDRDVQPFLGKVGSAAAYEAAARLDPAGCGSYDVLARQHIKFDRFKEAIAAIDRCSARSVDLERLRGSAHVQSGEYDAAIGDFSRAIDVLPFQHAASTFVMRGYAQCRAGHYGAAMWDYAAVQVAVASWLGGAIGMR